MTEREKRTYNFKEFLLIIGLIVGQGLISKTASAETATEPSFEVYGFAQADYIQDFRRVDPAWDDTLRPSKISTSSGEFGSDGQAIISPRQSRFGVKAGLPAGGDLLSTQFEFDLFGVGVDEGKTTIRLRHAWGEWKQWLAGQTHSLFMDIDIFPNVIDYWGPAGMVFLRNPQIRWTPVRGKITAAVALERPSNDIDPGQIREFSPELGNNIQNDEKVPDLTAQVRLKDNWGHVQVAGILRRVGYDTLGTPDNQPKNFRTGWGFDVTSVVKFQERDRVLLGVVYGQGIASYMNDGGTDLAPETSEGVIKPSVVPLFGISAYVEHTWVENWTSALGYSRTQVDNRNLQNGSAFSRGEYASVNLLYTPVKNMMVGAEALWGRRTNNDDSSINDVRGQISFKFNFSSKDLPIKL